MEYRSNGVLELLNLGIQGLCIRKFLNPIIPQFLNFTHYSIYFFPLSAASTLSGVIGSSLIRTPTAS
jgi:hypothetical protein